MSTESDFANLILGEWDSAMQRFFEAVDREKERHGLTDSEVYLALQVGYGGEVADNWDEWVADGSQE